VWASLDSVNDPAALDSVLCEGQETTNDPCPFPPLLQDAGFWDGLLLRLFFFGSLDIYLGFSYALVVPPPKLDFVDEMLAGSAKAKVAVYANSLFWGKSLLATIEADAGVTATVPEYDSDSGILKNFQLSSIDLLNPQLGVGVFSLFGLFGGLLLSAADFAVDAFSGTIIDLANNEIRGVLESTPIKVPEIKQFPTKTQTVSIKLVNPTINAVPSGPTTASFLSLSSGVSLDVLGVPASISLPFNSTMYTNGSYKTTYDWVVEYKDPYGLFSYSFYDRESGVMEMYSLRWSEAESRVEISDNNEDWIPAAPPIL